MKKKLEIQFKDVDVGVFVIDACWQIDDHIRNVYWMEGTGKPYLLVHYSRHQASIECFIRMFRHGTFQHERILHKILRCFPYRRVIRIENIHVYVMMATSLSSHIKCAHTHTHHDPLLSSFKDTHTLTHTHPIHGTYVFDDSILLLLHFSSSTILYASLFHKINV